MRVPEFSLFERDSRRDFVGDLDPDLFVGEGGNESVEARYSLEVLVDFFFGEDLRKPGRTIEKTMAAAPGTVVLIQELMSPAIPAFETILFWRTHLSFLPLLFDVRFLTVNPP